MRNNVTAAVIKRKVRGKTYDTETLSEREGRQIIITLTMKGADGQQNSVSRSPQSPTPAPGSTPSDNTSGRKMSETGSRKNQSV